MCLKGLKSSRLMINALGVGEVNNRPKKRFDVENPVSCHGEFIVLTQKLRL